MCDDFIKSVTQMLEELSISGSRDGALDSLNELFVSFNENLQLMDDDERASQRERCIEAQRVFHDAGLTIIQQLSGPPQPERMDVANEEPTEKSASATESNESPVASDQAENETSNAMALEDQGAWGGSEQTEQKSKETTAIESVRNSEQNVAGPSAAIVTDNASQWSRLPFLDFEQLFRPLFEIQQMSRVDETALNQFLVMLTEMREQAERLQFPLEQERQFIIALIQNRLDYVSRSLWMWQVDRNEPTLEQLVNFLVKRGSRIEAHERPQLAPAQGVVQRPAPAQGVVQRPAQAQGAIPRAPAPARAAGAGRPAVPKNKKHKPVCVSCGGEHYLHRCEDFKQMSLAQKRALLDHHRLCHNCFSSSHTTSQCNQNACKRCGTKHNSLVCPDGNQK